MFPAAGPHLGSYPAVKHLLVLSRRLLALRLRLANGHVLLLPLLLLSSLLCAQPVPCALACAAAAAVSCAA